ncbi:Uncharacterised protein [Chlamydia trachomatis]|nr:Uncharacterised protein [Chlamydia trachomatis]
MERDFINRERQYCVADLPYKTRVIQLIDHIFSKLRDSPRGESEVFEFSVPQRSGHVLSRKSFQGSEHRSNGF